MNDRVAIVLHAYHLMFIPEVCKYLDGLRGVIDFDVHVTTSEDKVEDLRKTPLVKFFPEIHVFENRGRDVLPFLKLIGRLGEYSVLCKIHTKRDQGMPEVPGQEKIIWRQYLYDSLLLPDNARIAMRELEKKSIYAPEGLYLNMLKNRYCRDNFVKMAKLPVRLGVAVSPGRFIAGTMFWVKTDSLMWIADYNLDDMFEEERGALDGEMENVFERSFEMLTKQERMDKYPFLAAGLKCFNEEKYREALKFFVIGEMNGDIHSSNWRKVLNRVLIGESIAGSR